MNHTFKIILSLLLVTIPAVASDYDVHIQALRNGTDAQRVAARQMLPREGMRAVPDVLELLHHDDQLVWRTAQKILSDICLTHTQRGYEVEREQVTEQLLTALTSEVPQHTAIAIIRLLSVTAPDDTELTALTPYFKDLAYRSETIDALTNMATMSACKLLEEQLNFGSTADKVEIIDALRVAGSRSNYVISRKLLRNPEAAVKVAAMRALASSGDPSHIKQFQKITRESPAELQTAAVDANIHLAEAILMRGGNWMEGIEFFKDILDRNESFSAKAAALAAFGKYGDARVIKVIFRAVKKSTTSELEAPALMGLEFVRGLEAYETLLSEYPKCRNEMQLGLLGVMGRKKDPIFLDLLLENAASDDPARQAVAFEALVQSELPGGADAVAAYVESRPAEDRKFDVEKLLAYADSMRHQNAKAAAGRAYLTLYQTTDNDEFREIAFLGIKQFPSSEAYKIILEDLDITDLSEVSVETLVALNVMLDPAEFPDEIGALRDAMLNAARTTSDVQSILEMANQQNVVMEYIPLMGFFTQWHLIGPFPWTASEGFTENPIGAPVVDLRATYTVGDKTLSWGRHDTGSLVNAMGLLGAHESASLFAYTTFDSSEEMAAQVRVGSDDGVCIWLNGESVHENNIDRGVLLDADVVPVTLRQGKNELLLQVTQGAGGWAFTARLTKPDGTPITPEYRNE